MTDTGHPSVGRLSIGCTGTLIGPRTVLTAAHCGWHAGKPNVSITFGDQTYPTHDLIRHAQYNPISNFDQDLAHDLAIVHLKQPVTSIAPSSAQNAQLSVGDPIEIVGFGETSVGQNDTGKRVAKNVIGEIRQLVFVFKHSPADGPQWGNVCHGDSGGPVFNQSGAVIGVHSMWDFKSMADTQGDYCWKTKGGATRVDKFQGWILGYLDQQIGVGEGFGTYPPASSDGGAGGGNGPASCAGRCGDTSEVPIGSCYCDEQCTSVGDCCADYDQLCFGGGPGGQASCLGHCGSSEEIPGGGCYCDPFCLSNGDCCFDYSSACGL